MQRTQMEKPGYRNNEGVCLHMFGWRAPDGQGRQLDIQV